MTASQVEDRRLNVLFLEPQPCIRAKKYAEGFQEGGNGEYVISFAYQGKTLTELYGEGDELFEGWFKLSKEHPCKDLVWLLTSKKFDIIHSHNAPDHLTLNAIKARELSGIQIPVIQDNHDVISMRKTPYEGFENRRERFSEEEIANEKSDARIHVTKGVENYIISKYGSKGDLDLVFNSFVSQEIIPHEMEMLPKLSKRKGGIHIVYQGTIDEENRGSHYDLLEIFKEIIGKGIHLYVYTTREAGKYKELAMKEPFLHFEGRLKPKGLMIAMTKYDFGWAGFNGAKNPGHLEVTLANKVMEYLGAGLPVISFNHKSQREFLEKYGVGIIINSLDELPDAVNGNGMRKIQQSVLDKRFDFTVEKNIGKVEELYERLVS